MWFDSDGFPAADGLSGIFGMGATAAEKKAAAAAKAAAAKQAALAKKQVALQTQLTKAKTPAQVAKIEKEINANVQKGAAPVATGPVIPAAAVITALKKEIAAIQANLDKAKAAGVDAPEWRTYMECLQARLTDAARACTKPGNSIAKIIAAAKKAPAKAAADTAAIKQDDNAQVSKIQAAVSALCTKIKPAISSGWKNPKSRAKAMQKAAKYGLTIDAQGNVSGDCKPPAALQNKVASANIVGKKKKATKKLKGLHGLGADFDPTQPGFIDPGAGAPIDPSNPLGIGTSPGGADSNALLLTLLSSGDTEPPKQCANGKGGNKPVCVMFRMQESNRQMFVLLIMFLTEMQQDMADLISTIQAGGTPGAAIDPTTGLPYNIDPSTGLPYGAANTLNPYADATGGVPFVTGPSDGGYDNYDPTGGGFLDTSSQIPEGMPGGADMVTGPMMVDDAVSDGDSFVDGSFNEGAPQQIVVYSQNPNQAPAQRPQFYPNQVTPGSPAEGGTVIPYGPTVNGQDNYAMFDESAPTMVMPGGAPPVDVGMDFDPNADFVADDTDIFTNEPSDEFGMSGPRHASTRMHMPGSRRRMKGMGGLGCDGDMLCSKCSGTGSY